MENLPIVHVVNGRQKKLLQGHPWVYGNEIERVEGEIEDGGLVTVVDFPAGATWVRAFTTASR